MIGGGAGSRASLRGTLGSALILPLPLSGFQRGEESLEAARRRGVPDWAYHGCSGNVDIYSATVLSQPLSPRPAVLLAKHGQKMWRRSFGGIQD